MSLTSSQPLLSLKGAGVARSGRWLVRGIDLDVAPGEIVTLIGPNGSGKSTTAKLALGVLRPDEGSAMRRAGLAVGYVPQKVAVDWTMPLTVKRFMTLTNRLEPAEIDRALARTGISRLAGAELRHLSGGEFQRAMLARAIARKPDLLVLDEPVQGVDFSGEIALYELIGAIREEIGCGILLISHDLHVVMAATDQVVCLNGHVCCKGSPSAVVASREYRQLFGDRAAEALAVYRHSHDHTHLPDGTVRHADGTITDHCHPEDGHHPHEHRARARARALIPMNTGRTCIPTVMAGMGTRGPGRARNRQRDRHEASARPSPRTRRGRITMLDDFFVRAHRRGRRRRARRRSPRLLHRLAAARLFRRYALACLAARRGARLSPEHQHHPHGVRRRRRGLARAPRPAAPRDALLGLAARPPVAFGAGDRSRGALLPDLICRVDLMGFLFGDILAVSRTDIAIIYAGGLAVLLVLAFIWRPLLAATVNGELAAAEGMRPERAQFVFMLLMATVIAIAMKIVGVLLITALLIIPAATARRFASAPETMAVLAALIGAVAVVAGLSGSLDFDTPSGPSIVVAALVFFVISLSPALERLVRPSRPAEEAGQ